MNQGNLTTVEAPAADEAVGEIAIPVVEPQKPKGGGDKKNGFWREEWKRIKKHRALLWFVIPAIAISVIFAYVPMIWILFAFRDSYTTSRGADFVYNWNHSNWTFRNILQIFSDDKFGLAVGNTLLINVIRLAFCFPLSILIAVQLSELKSQTLAKVILIILTIPNFLSWAIVIGTWSGLLDPKFGFLGKEIGYNLIGSSSWFKPLVVFFSAWKGAGWGCILYYSAIVSIDKTYYESATLEGANKLQKMWYLTIPSILSTIALTLVLNISSMMATGFEQVYTMMQINMGPLSQSQVVLDTYIYEISIINKTDLPFATALGVFNGLIGLTLMLVGNAITSKTMKRGLW